MSLHSPFPTLLIDPDKVRANIERMSNRAQQAQVEFRPHFKTHQSLQVGRIFREYGVTAITVSSIRMAEYFADDAWTDITIAFSVNLLAADYYNKLAAVCTLKTLVISEDSVRQIDTKLKHQLGLYVEIDPEYGRSGIPASDTERISAVLEAIRTSKNCYIAGFYCHAGHTYNCRSTAEINEVAGNVLGILTSLKKQFPDIPVCFGDTPSCSVLDEFGPVDQISPGNFVFYDWMQVIIGSCSPEDIAVTMLCPIIEKFDERKQVLIHGGAIHFSKEYVDVNNNKNFGQVITPNLSADNYLEKLSQEHGVITCTADTYESLLTGRSIEIYPVHSCLTANLMGSYISRNGSSYDHMNGK